MASFYVNFANNHAKRSCARRPLRPPGTNVLQSVNFHVRKFVASCLVAYCRSNVLATIQAFVDGDVSGENFSKLSGACSSDVLELRDTYVLDSWETWTWGETWHVRVRCVDCIEGLLSEGLRSCDVLRD